MTDEDPAAAFIASINERMELAVDADTSAQDRDAVAKQIARDVGPLTPEQLVDLRRITALAADEQLGVAADSADVISRSVRGLQAVAADAHAADTAETLEQVLALVDTMRGTIERAARYFAVASAFEDE